MTFKVGDTLWYQPSGWGGSVLPGYEVTVEKAGTKWLTVERGRTRLDKETLIADGGGYSSPGRAYVSKSAYEMAVKTSRLWSAFRRAVDRKIEAPAYSAIVSAAFALDIKLEDDT